MPSNGSSTPTTYAFRNLPVAQEAAQEDALTALQYTCRFIRLAGVTTRCMPWTEIIVTLAAVMQATTQLPHESYRGNAAQ